MESAEMLSVLHLTAAAGRATFGVGAVALALAAAQRRLGATSVLWSCDDPCEAEEIRRRDRLSEQELIAFSVAGPRWLVFSPALERAARGAAAHALAVVHQHGIWMAFSRFTNRWRKTFARPTVVAPHGSLTAWALRRSRWKKRLALWAYEGANLHAAACLHALSDREATECRQFGLRNPVAVIPNGISHEWLSSTGEAARFRQRYGLPGGKRLMFFLSRVTPKKGLPMLLDAISTLRQQFADWLAVIAGPDEFGHLAELQSQSARLKLGELVQFVGPLYGEDRRDAFAAAELFVLPTHSEGAPVAVFEALGAGLPVLTTVGAPCDYLVTEQCGWWTQIDASAIATALCEAVGRPADELAAMGARGREVVRQRFTWGIAAQKTLDLYRWLLGQRGKPEFVLVD